MKKIMKTERIMIRVSKELKEQIERDANDLNLSISSYIRMKLSK